MSFAGCVVLPAESPRRSGPLRVLQSRLLCNEIVSAAELSTRVGGWDSISLSPLSVSDLTDFVTLVSFRSGAALLVPLVTKVILILSESCVGQRITWQGYTVGYGSPNQPDAVGREVWQVLPGRTHCVAMVIPIPLAVQDKG